VPILRLQSDLLPAEDFGESLRDLRNRGKGEIVKVYNATFFVNDKIGDKVVPVAAQSLQHAARKAAKEEKFNGELIKVELTKDILI
jgi:hypothetical protein